MTEWKRNMKRNSRIRELRKKGYSIPEIARKLNISKSTTSLHCKNVTIENPERMKKRIKENGMNGCKAAKKKWDDKKTEIKKLAEKEWTLIRKDPEMMGFLGLYWGEGSKRNGKVEIVNNDYGVILAAIKIFERLCPDKNFEITVKYYPEQKPEQCRKFWEKILRKPIRLREKKWLGKTRRIYSINGLCTVRFSDWSTYTRIVTWLNLWKKELLNESGRADSNRRSRVPKTRALPN